MDDKMKIGAAIAGGYLLGRTKKGKVALSLALWLAGSTGLDPKRLIRKGLVEVARSPDVRNLAEQIRGPVTEAGRNALVATIESRVNRLADTLHERTASLQAASGLTEGAVPRQASPSEGEPESEGKPGSEGKPEPEEKREGTSEEESKESSEQEPAGQERVDQGSPDKGSAEQDEASSDETAGQNARDRAETRREPAERSAQAASGARDG